MADSGHEGQEERLVDAGREGRKEHVAGGGAVGERGDSALADSAPRRTYLAAERTYLAWLRTGLGSLGLALAVGRLIPALIDSSHAAFALLGTGYGLLAVLLLVYAWWRQRSVRRALVANAPLPLDGWVVTVLTMATLVLAVVTIALVVVEI